MFTSQNEEWKEVDLYDVIVMTCPFLRPKHPMRRPDGRLNRKIGRALTQVEVKDRGLFSTSFYICSIISSLEKSIVTMVRVIFALALCVATVSAFVAPANHAGEFLVVCGSLMTFVFAAIFPTSDRT